VQGSRITSRALQGASKTGRPPEAGAKGAEHDRLGTVFALIVGDLTRTWRKQRREQGATGADEPGRLAGGVPKATPYTSVWG
jgi:hypothetical protein